LGSNSTLAEIENALALAPLQLRVGFTMVDFGRGQGVVYSPERLFRFLRDPWPHYLEFLDISASDIRAITAIYGQLRQHNQALLDVKPLIAQLHELEGFPRLSPLRFLGYFALLESLLTHSPKAMDPYDSITRQVKKKIALLDRRFEFPLDYGPFRAVTEKDRERVWSRMYDYRSAIAHGSAPSFGGELKILGSHEKALKFLTQTVRASIRQALVEPQLVIDLRDC